MMEQNKMNRNEDSLRDSGMMLTAPTLELRGPRRRREREMVCENT